MGLRGYRSLAFAESFRHFGEVLALPSSGLPLIERPLEDGSTDLIGPYPFAACRGWPLVQDDVAWMRARGAVSVVFVVDPFDAEQAREALAGWTVCRPFKTQFVVDLSGDWRALRAKNVRNRANQALRRQTLEVAQCPWEHADEFWELYQAVSARRGAAGIQLLGPDAVAAQLRVEGSVLMVARREGRLLGALLSYHQGEVGHLHLTGQAPEGYALGTSYALLEGSLGELARRGCRWANLGGPAGLNDDPGDGLYRFKSRWTRHRRHSLLCGQILDPAAYRRLVALAGATQGDFFPAYRAPGSALEWRPVPPGARDPMV